jgi:hypothetical protein
LAARKKLTIPVGVKLLETVGATTEVKVTGVPKTGFGGLAETAVVVAALTTLTVKG